MQFQKWFIKNEKILSETSKCIDLLDWDNNINEFSEKISKIRWSAILWFIWDFWVGKSTLIDNVQKLREKDNSIKEKRIEFDSWKYPDRKNLWEGFVLDFAKQVDKITFDKAKKEIDWEQYKDKEILMKTIGSALWTFLPWWNIVSNLSHFFKSSPARRVFEIQEILIELIKEVKELRIVIVIEDIDRSGDAGIFFLETLKQFISTNDFNKEILIIVPLWTKEYYNHIDSYLKPIDYFEFFNPQTINLQKFINEVFIDEIIENENLYWPLKDFLEWIFKYYWKDINLRKLKLILRKANQNHLIMYWKFDQIFELDRRLNIIFETIKYIEYDENNKSFFDNCLEKWILQNSLIWSYIYNLVYFTTWNQNKYYYYKGNSLLEEEYNQISRKNIKKLIQPRLPFIFLTEITNKEIIWWRYEDFDQLKKIVVPQQYLNY